MSETIKQEYELNLPPGTKFKFDEGDRLLGIEAPRSKPRKTVIRLSNKEKEYEHFISIESKLSIDEIKDIARMLIQ